MLWVPRGWFFNHEIKLWVPQGWFFGFLGDGLWFLNYVLPIMGQRGNTRHALPCRCQPRVSTDRAFSPPSARVRAPPAHGGLWQLFDW